MTRTNGYYEIIAHLPIGIYVLDEDDNVSFANPTWLAVHGYKDLDEVKGQNIREFFANSDDVVELRRRIYEEDIVSDVVYEMRRSNDERFFALIYSRAIRGEGDSYQGREGAVIDVTDRQIYHRIMADLPIGYYSVRSNFGRDTIIYCNDQFTDMFEFESKDHAIGSDFKDLYRSTKDYDRFNGLMNRSKESFANRQQIRMMSVKGKELNVELNVHAIYDKKGTIVGQFGIVRDLGEDKPLSNLRKNIGLILHSYTTKLISIRHSIESAMKTLGPDPFSEDTPPIPAELDSALTPLMTGLASALDDMITLLKERAPELLDKVRVETMSDQLLNIEKIRRPQRYHLLQEIMQTLVKDADELQKQRILPRELIKRVRDNGKDIDRIISLYFLHSRERDIVEFDREVESLRTIVTKSLSVKGQYSIIDFWEIISHAIQSLNQFASLNNVTIKQRNFTRSASVWAIRSELLRAVSNLLHNAIKYSWQGKDGTWVGVDLKEDGDWLLLEIQNYGVPIPEEELESGAIYQFGYRSRISADRGRLGSGIGLYDAKDVIEGFGGTLEITSVPVSKPVDKSEEMRPYLTKVFVSLPKIQ